VRSEELRGAIQGPVASGSVWSHCADWLSKEQFLLATVSATVSTLGKQVTLSKSKCFGLLEARVGFEPTNGGFADLSLGPLGYRAKQSSIANHL
jgi:hypothetical protein